MAPGQRLQRSVAVGALLPDEDSLTIAADIWLPDIGALASPPVVLFCQPGGALAKGYYDLVLEDGSAEFSFARHLVAQGCIVVAIDHLGIGASSRPRDGFALTPDVLIAANARAVDELAAQLRNGQLTPELPALPDLVSIGVGHSMGAMLTAMQQARYRSYAAVALLGFGTQGLVDFLPEAARAYIGDAAGARANIERIARGLGGDPYAQLTITSGSAREIYGGGADRRAVAALAGARTNLLAVAGMFSMIPGGSAPDCAQIDVPVFLAVGTRDICGPPHLIPAAFTASSDVSLLVLPETGHSHFLFASSARLFARLGGWLSVVS
jgi:pimeloyl-ACP methyl ester carboxylesterase